MNSYLLDVIRRYGRKGLIIDTNVAILYLIGSIDLSLIRNLKRTAVFTEDDFERLSKFIEFFPNLYTIPNILTEISNLIPRREEISSALLHFIRECEEIRAASSTIAEDTAFTNLGLTDAAIICAARSGILALTDDGPLYGFMRTSGIDAITLKDVREI